MIRGLISSFTSPSIHNTEPEPERHATWLELFFDLVFVVAVAELVHLLEENPSLGGVFEFALLFVPVWWIWITYSYYGDLFDDGDVLYPLASLAAMFGVVVWSTTFHDAFHGGSAAFAVGYLALRGLNAAQYAFVGRVVPGARTLARRIALGYLVGLTFWIVSFLVPEPTRYVLWAIGITIEVFSTPAIYMTYDAESLPRQESHMDERFGLFTIIVLGETVVAVADSAADIALGLATGFAAICGFVGAVCLWWLYFGYTDMGNVNRLIRSDARRRATLRWTLYGYGHLFVFASIAAGGVGISLIIEAAAAGTSLTANERLLAGGATCAYLLAVALVHRASPLVIPSRVLAARLLTAGMVVIIVLAGGALGATAIGGALAVVLTSLVAFEVSRSGRAVASLEAEIGD